MPAAHEAPLWQLPMLARAPETGGTRAVLEREARSHYPVCGVTKTAIYRPKDIGLREDRARGGQGIDGGVDALGSTRHEAPRVTTRWGKFVRREIPRDACGDARIARAGGTRPTSTVPQLCSGVAE